MHPAMAASVYSSRAWMPRSVGTLPLGLVIVAVVSEVTRAAKNHNVRVQTLRPPSVGPAEANQRY